MVSIAVLFVWIPVVLVPAVAVTAQDKAVQVPAISLTEKTRVERSLPATPKRGPGSRPFIKPLYFNGKNLAVKKLRSSSLRDQHFMV